MAMGVAEFPSETLKPLYIPTASSRQDSQESIMTKAKKSDTLHISVGSTPLTSPAEVQTSLNGQEPLNHLMSLSNVPDSSSATSRTELTSTSNALQDQLGSKQEKASRSLSRSQDKSGSGKNQDMLRHTGVHTSKGLGRIVKAAVQAPMEISVSMTKGLHNMPKLWADDTVRPQEQISDFKLGAVAAGKEFGYGWYDGVTGLVTQPWKGAQKDGASGFFKGVGKGIGGFATKPLAGLYGILGHTMKGIHKEVQKLFGSNVESYIVASRVAQGYEEWLQSSDSEKEDVIVRWKWIQKYLKKEYSPEEMMQDVLDAQRKNNQSDAMGRQNSEHHANSAQSAIADYATLDSENAIASHEDPEDDAHI